MLRDHRSPDPLPFNPPSARNLAAACAVVGLGTVLLSERPTAGEVLLAWGGLAGWGLLRLVGARRIRPAHREPHAPPPLIGVVEVAEAPPRNPAAVVALPKPIIVAPTATDRSIPPHPAVLTGLRRRRLPEEPEENPGAAPPPSRRRAS
ncbi:hypothetical protein [Methylobacterium nonmethylotrophicum]|uniref:Uncharacterized protein n=1 Tax=Methylobacterium nonmethylotrophicum TaxID=1141884 RepID=A0A4Z0NTE5_9HYPH|nr:hypothetical protein [Methylobacterium nonmethylotrophicum]TGE00310.1 hypothetical protein EU555_10535 [Methylobacterium nonmethylotrophicum]